MATRSFTSSTTDVFPAVGDGGQDQVVNVSGQRWPGAQMRPRGRTMPTTPPGQHLSPRTARMIDAQSGEQLDQDLGQRLTAAAQRKASVKATIDRADPMGEREEDYLRTVLGVPRA